jgi:surface antigen
MRRKRSREVGGPTVPRVKNRRGKGVAMRTFLISALVVCFLAAGLGCNKAQQGATGGALAGATIGALTFNNKLLGAAVGAGVGLMVGYIIGNEWDKSDEKQVQQTLESGRSNETASWTNPDTGVSYSATPSPAYTEENRVYRDVTIKDEKSGEVVKAQAWRDENGVWHIKDEPQPTS